MKIVAFDPGGTTGIALFDTEGSNPYQPIRIAQPKTKLDLYKELQEFTDADICVIENYRIRPNVIHDWSNVDTLRIIGYIMYWCDMNKIPYKLQEPVNKVPAYGWLGMKYVKGKPNMHIQDAVAHGAFYMHKTMKMSLP